MRPGSEVPAFDGEPRFALITVNFSTTRYLKLMLLTLMEQENLGLLTDIVICDNGSRDDANQFLATLERDVPRVSVVRNRHLLSHARGVRTGMRTLAQLDANRTASHQKQSNIYLYCDTDVIFLNPKTLSTLASVFSESDSAFAGELRQHLYPYPEAQASFLAVRKDWAHRKATTPWVDHGAPAYWMQRSIWQQGGNGIDFPSNKGGFILHRGRAGSAAAGMYRKTHNRASVKSTAPHYMGIPGGADIWNSTEQKYADLLDSPDPRPIVSVIAKALGS